ncbi:MAG: cryptochrome/photolyase family protein [Granulosicoccus sp.]
MTSIALVFPNQLYKDHPVLRVPVEKVLLLEDSLFFGDSQYPLRFHKQKLAYHRATMRHFANEVVSAGVTNLEYIPYCKDNQLPTLCKRLKQEGATRLITVSITDFVLSRRLRDAALKTELTWLELSDPGFINTPEENRTWRKGRKRWFMTDFYQWQRKRHSILVENNAPTGGQWSFDEHNRKKLPRKEIEILPVLPIIKPDPIVLSAVESVKQEFPDHPGSLTDWHYPYTHRQAEQWLDLFLEQRFAKFGPFEDAMVAGQNWLHHSIISPLLNVGLLTPGQVIERALSYAEKHDTPLNSVEGFVRQILGWREFMRATYDDLGVTMRTRNNWQHHRPLPQAFYSATTGIDPIDDVIERVLGTGYCHHIERLMLLGGFMFLCEIAPKDIYSWFMEMFVDSYDWVMVPNVYAMSQHADGGAITTKPYFSGSNYVLKMSNYKKGEWSIVWDGLFWRWILKHQKELAGNARWAMMVRNAQKMDSDKQQSHIEVAENYLAGLETLN